MRAGLALGLALLPQWPSIGHAMQIIVPVQVPNGLLAPPLALRSPHAFLNGAEPVTHCSCMHIPAALLPRVRTRNSALCQARLHPSGPQYSSDVAGDGPASSADESAAALGGDASEGGDPSAGGERAAGATRIFAGSIPVGVDIADVEFAEDGLQCTPLWFVEATEGEEARTSIVLPIAFVPADMTDLDIDALVVALPPSALPKGKRAPIVPESLVARVAAAQVPAENSKGVSRSSMVPVVLALVLPEFLESCIEPPEPQGAGHPELIFKNRAAAPRLPSLESLVALAAERLGYESYETGASGADGSRRPPPEPPPRAEPKAPPVPQAQPMRGETSVEQRMELMQTQISQLHSMLHGRLAPPPPPASSVGAGATPLSAMGPPYQKSRTPAHVPKSFDPAAVKAALEAGISQEDLSKLGVLLGSASSRLSPEPGLAGQRKPAGPLDDEEEEVGGEDGNAGVLSPVEQAVVELSKISKTLAKQSPKSDSDPLERALDGLLGGISVGGEGASAMSTRKGAAAYLLLKKALTESPKKISEPIISRMREKNRLSAAHATDSDSLPDPFFYLEHRSKVSNFQTNINWAWLTAGVILALFRGDTDEALARALLMLAVGEQVSLDRGSWQVAWEISLMEEPPYDSFRRGAPENPKAARSTQMPHSQLLDPRVFEVILSRLRDRDDMNERRRKLERPSLSPGDGWKAPTPPPPPKPSKPKPKADPPPAP